MDKANKIVLCVDRLTGGGAERVASLWIQGFTKLGYDVYIVMRDTDSPITYCIPSTVKLFNIGFSLGNRYLNKIARILFSDLLLERKLKQINPDIAIGVMYDWGLKLLKVRKKLKYKIIQTEHNSFERPSTNPMSEKDRWLKFEVNKKVDLVTVLTQSDFDFIGPRLDNVMVLPNPLSFAPVTKIPLKSKIILGVGRLDAWHVKGFDLLIDAWGKIAHKYPDWKLRIMGNGSPSSQELLMRMACRNKVDSQFELFPFQNDPVPIYKDASIFVLSSRYEGFGMVLIEAMSQGCACVACDYKGRQKEIIQNEKQGLLCNTENTFDLCCKIETLILNDSLREEMQRNSPIRAFDYNIDNIMDKWQKIVEYLRLR